MTPNPSAGLSYRIQELMRRDVLQFIEPLFPVDAIHSYVSKSAMKRRDRVFNMENTFLTMVVTAIQEDKSLQNAVNIFQEVFHPSQQESLCQAAKEQQQLQAACSQVTRRPGRPRLFKVKVAVSKTKPISQNTGAYSRARDRVEQGLINSVYAATTQAQGLDCVKPWHGRIVYNTDGTYFQMQDSPKIPDKYRAQKNGNGTLQGYPQGLLQVLTQHGSGFIADYRIAARTDSELKQMAQMSESIGPKSLVLADDLYNCYAMISLCIQRGIDMIVPDKKDRNFEVIRAIAPGDDIVRINKPAVIKPLVTGQILPPYLTLRRITYTDTLDTEVKHVLLTTILDETIEKTEIVTKYSGRWDVEITIREVKTLMGMNIARTQSEDMVFKEMGVAITAYNLLRRIIAESTKETAFPPETDFFQELLTHSTLTLVDRKGRVYSRWAPGRPPHSTNKGHQAHNSIPTRAALPEKNQSGKVSKI
jgi:hypothetical protein